MGTFRQSGFHIGCGNFWIDYGSMPCGCNRFLRFNYCPANGAVAALGQSGLCAGGRNRCVNGGRMGDYKYNFLRFNYCPANGAVAALGQSGLCAGGRNRCVDGRRMLVCDCDSAGSANVASIRADGKDVCAALTVCSDLTVGADGCHIFVAALPFYRLVICIIRGNNRGNGFFHARL